MLLLARSPAAAQSRDVGAFFDRLTAEEGFRVVRLEQKMMRMMGRTAAQRGDAQLAELLDGLRFIRIVASGSADGAALARAADAAVAADSGFRPLTTVTEEGRTTRFYLCEPEDSEGDSELVMISGGGRETVVVDVFGRFDLRQVVRLSSIRP